jgi:hypothetical protein
MPLGRSLLLIDTTVNPVQTLISYLSPPQTTRTQITNHELCHHAVTWHNTEGLSKPAANNPPGKLGKGRWATVGGDAAQPKKKPAAVSRISKTSPERFVISSLQPEGFQNPQGFSEAKARRVSLQSSPTQATYNPAPGATRFADFGKKKGQRERTVSPAPKMDHTNRFANLKEMWAFRHNGEDAQADEFEAQLQTQQQSILLLQEKARAALDHVDGYLDVATDSD